MNSRPAAACNRIADALIPVLPAVAGAPSTSCSTQTASSAVPCSWPIPGSSDDMLTCIDALRWGKADLFKLVPDGEQRVLAVLDLWGIAWPEA